MNNSNLLKSYSINQEKYQTKHLSNFATLLRTRKIQHKQMRTFILKLTGKEVFAVQVTQKQSVICLMVPDKYPNDNDNSLSFGEK